MGVEAMRRTGYAAVDALVARLADPEADPVLRRASPAEMRARLGGPAPEQGGGLDAVLARVIEDVLPYAAGTNHPGYFAFIPYFTTWPAAVAELIATAANVSPWAWMESPAATQIELEVIDWFRSWLGMPEGTAGVLVSGGSAANLTALLVAREAAGGPSEDSVVYVSDQGHSSLARTARAMGLRPHQVRVLPTDDHWRLQPEAVAAAASADRRAGRVPIAVCAGAGATSTGAVDPLVGLADVCAAEGLWLHVDAAYGGFAALTAKGWALLAGIERADSVTLDPHKWLFQPFECGGVLIRDRARLARTFAIHPDYLDSTGTHAPGEVNLGDWGLQLSRGFRALKVWMSVQAFGLAAFRAAIDRDMELAAYAEELVRGQAELTLMAPATLGIVCFRREWPGCDEAETERRGIALADAVGAENLCHQVIFVDDAARAVTPPHAELIQIGEAICQGTHRRGLVQGTVRPVGVVEALVLAQHGHQVALVPDQGPVAHGGSCRSSVPLSRSSEAPELRTGRHGFRRSETRRRMLR
jgi:glutamate/tyrosine decarboxylase-like PLP-dependent enzyme